MIKGVFRRETSGIFMHIAFIMEERQDFKYSFNFCIYVVLIVTVLSNCFYNLVTHLEGSEMLGRKVGTKVV